MSQVFFISRQWLPQRLRSFVQSTCAPDVPCRCPEWLPGAEVEGKWLHLREVYATEWPAEPFRAAGEFQKSAAESAYRQYRVVRWFLLPETELCLRPAATLDCKSCVAKWTRTGTGGRMENPAQQRYNCHCHQPFLAIIRTAGLAVPKRKKRMLDFASALRRVRDSNPRTR